VVAANRLVEDAKPWALARDERGGDTGAGRRLDAVLWDLAESLRLVAEALRPLLPATAAAIAEQLGVGLAPCWARGLDWGGLSAGTRVRTAVPLFPRREPGQAASLARE
jgi:methionyl-tRNA synthetase